MWTNDQRTVAAEPASTDGLDDELVPLPDLDVPEGVTSLGRTIVVKGELVAREHLIIEGRFEGRLSVPDHDLAIGRHAVVTAEIFAGSVTVLGTAKGQLTATEAVELRPTASVEGEIVSARLAIDEGAYFRGRVDPKRADAAVAVARHRIKQAIP